MSEEQTQTQAQAQEGDGAETTGTADKAHAGSDTPTPTIGEGQSTAATAEDGPNGFPEDTPLAEMTDRQQAAYWKHHARRHEAQAKALAGQAQSDRSAAAKALEDAVTAAREQARHEARAEFGRESVVMVASGRLMDAGLEADAAKVITDAMNASVFLTDSGEVDASRLGAYLDAVMPRVRPSAKRGESGWPDLGQGVQGGGSPTGLGAGAALFEAERDRRNTNING